MGRFLLAPGDGSTVQREQRLVLAAGLAGQAAAALASARLAGQPL